MKKNEKEPKRISFDQEKELLIIDGKQKIELDFTEGLYVNRVTNSYGEWRGDGVSYSKNYVYIEKDYNDTPNSFYIELTNKTGIIFSKKEFKEIANFIVNNEKFKKYLENYIDLTNDFNPLIEMDNYVYFKNEVLYSEQTIKEVILDDLDTFRINKVIENDTRNLLREFIDIASNYLLNSNMFTNYFPTKKDALRKMFVEISNDDSNVWYKEFKNSTDQSLLKSILDLLDDEYIEDNINNKLYNEIFSTRIGDFVKERDNLEFEISEILLKLIINILETLFQI